MEALTTREQVIEVVNRLFIYVDNQEWSKLQEQVFAPKVHFDMSSLGAEIALKPSKQICDEWAAGFEGIDAINHLSGNYLVSVDREQADVFCYATATHYKESATQGKTREFVGTYELKLEYQSSWRIHSFKYVLKYMNGNLELK